MAPLDARRLRRTIITYAASAMAGISLVATTLAVTPAALQLRDNARADLRLELALKVAAASETAARAVNLAQQVTSRTVIRQKLEAYNHGDVGLEELSLFTADKLADALNLSPDLIAVARYAGKGELVVRLGNSAVDFPPALPPAADTILSLSKHGGDLHLSVAAPILNRDGHPVGSDLVVMDAAPLKVLTDEVKALGRFTQSALVQAAPPYLPVLATESDFKAGPITQATLTAPVMVADGDFVVAAAPLAGTPWAMVLRMPADEATRHVDRIVAGAAAGAALVIALGVFGLTRLLHPLTGAFLVQADVLNRQINVLQTTQGQLAAKTAALEAANAELQEYTYAASHDLQEPIRSIIGFSQLLQRRCGGKLGPEADEFIAFIVEGGERMRRQINDLLNYAKLGRLDQDFAPIDMNALIGEVLRVLDQAVQDSGALLEIGDLPAVQGNRDSLSRLLQNLIANAMKFTKPGEHPHVRISAHRENDMAHISVADNGIGIDPQYHERIFRMFERLNPRSAFDGSGIGLAVCRKIVDMHNGRIWAESNLGRGCVMHVLLPLSASRQTIESLASRQTIESSASRQGAESSASRQGAESSASRQGAESSASRQTIESSASRQGAENSAFLGPNVPATVSDRRDAALTGQADKLG